MVLSGHAEIDQAGPTLIVDQDILGLDVLVGDPAGVEVGDGPRQLDHKLGGLAWPGTVPGHELLQGQGVEVLHHKEPSACVNIEVENPNQIGMFALGQEPPLAQQSVATGLVLVRHRPTGQLEDALLAKLGVDHAEDLGLAAVVEAVEHHVLADPLWLLGSLRTLAARWRGRSPGLPRASWPPSGRTPTARRPKNPKLDRPHAFCDGPDVAGSGLRGRRRPNRLADPARSAAPSPTLIRARNASQYSSRSEQ